MPAPIVIRSEFIQTNDPGWTLAQVIRKDGTWLMLVDVDSIALNVYDTDDKTTVIASLAPSKAATVFDTPQYAGGLWTEDDIGANFAFYMDNSVVFANVADEGGKVYLAQYDLECNDGSNRVTIQHYLTCKDHY